MDYEKLAVAIKLCGSTPKVDQCPQCPYWASGDMNNCIPRVTADSATAITDLLARAEVAEARCKLAEKCFDDSVLHACETQLELEKKARTEAEARAEKAERERDELFRILNDVCQDVRAKSADEYVCGLCEYDGAHIGESGDWVNECPGFEKDDCFCIKKSMREKFGQKEE